MKYVARYADGVRGSIMLLCRQILGEYTVAVLFAVPISRDTSEERVMSRRLPAC